jgi:signal transduction histidine kinase
MRPSIRRRFLLLTALLIVTVMGGTAIFILWRMDRSLRRDLDQTLRTEALALAARLEAEEGHVQFEMEESSIAQAKIGGDVLIQVLTDDGKPLFTSPQLKGAPGSDDWFRHVKPEDDVSWFDATPPPGLHSHRVAAFHATVAEEEESRRHASIGPSLRAWVFVARPLAPVEKATRRLALTLAKAILFATFITLVGGYIVASYGTRPIREVADRIAGIEPGHLRLEIDPSRVPLELDPIVQKTDSLLQRIDEELCRQRRLTADVAHDLRTPVAGVRTLLDVCVQRERTAGEYIETIGAAQAALRQLSMLLDNVLTLARLDSNAERPLFAGVRISDAIGDATAVLKPMAAVRHIDIHSVGPVDSVIPCDRTMLGKILTNLLANAVEYTSPNSLVILAIEKHETRLVIHVRDRGPGVPDEQRERIFDRFVRGDAARAGSANHSGLGLPIARGLARLLGGDVRLNPDSSNLGSDFVIELPTTREA